MRWNGRRKNIETKRRTRQSHWRNNGEIKMKIRLKFMLVEWTGFFSSRNAYYWFAAWTSIDLMWMKTGRKTAHSSTRCRHILYFAMWDGLVWNIDLYGKSLTSEKENKKNTVPFRGFTGWNLMIECCNHISCQIKWNEKKEEKNGWLVHARWKKLFVSMCMQVLLNHFFFCNLASDCVESASI